jgi:hypothetical protein
MKKIILTLSSLMLLNSVHAMIGDEFNLIKMPDKEALITMLDSLGMDVFYKKTSLIEDLADKDKLPVGVYHDVMLASAGLRDGCDNKDVNIVVRKAAPFVVRRILKDNPAAINYLELVGLLKAIGKKQTSQESKS